MESVMAMTVAPRLLAYRAAFSVRWEYRGKLMGIKTSSLPMRNICSKVSLVELELMQRTWGKIWLK